MAIAVYGIPSCDTVRKARAWLDERRIEYRFHDYKKLGVEPDRLAHWADEIGWEALFNTRGTSFRKLPEADRADIGRGKALALMHAQPSLIRRPVVEQPGGLLIGFDPARWSQTFG